MKKNLQKQVGHSVRLKQAVFLEGGGSNEVSAESSIASVGRSHGDRSG